MITTIKGVYFESEKDVSTYYLITAHKILPKKSVTVRIYTTDIPDNYFDTKNVVNGSEVEYPEYSVTSVVEIRLWGKYFFLEFNNDIQHYYDGKKYYGQNISTDSNTSLAEAINYGIDYGLNKFGLVPY